MTINASPLFTPGQDLSPAQLQQMLALRDNGAQQMETTGDAGGQIVPINQWALDGKFGATITRDPNTGQVHIHQPRNVSTWGGNDSADVWDEQGRWQGASSGATDLRSLARMTAASVGAYYGATAMNAASAGSTAATSAGGAGVVSGGSGITAGTTGGGLTVGGTTGGGLTAGAGTWSGVGTATGAGGLGTSTLAAGAGAGSLSAAAGAGGGTVGGGITAGAGTWSGVGTAAANAGGAMSWADWGQLALSAYQVSSANGAARDAANANSAASQAQLALGMEQLGENRRQFDATQENLRPIIQNQQRMAQVQTDQAQEMFRRSQEANPLEDEMLAFASDWRGQSAANDAERTAISDLSTRNADELRARTDAYGDWAGTNVKLLMGPNSGIETAYKDDIGAQVDQAVGDTRVGQTAGINTAIRQGLRYGMNPAEVAAAAGRSTGAAQAAAANNARTGAVDSIRGRIAAGLETGRQQFLTTQGATADAMDRSVSSLTTRRNNRIQDEGITFGRAADVVGLRRGLVGASQGAYSVATAAGTNASNSILSSNNQYLQASGQGYNTITQGNRMQADGANNQLNNANALQRQNQSNLWSMVGYGFGNNGD